MSSKFTKEVKRDHQQSKDVYRHLNEAADLRDSIDQKLELHQRHDRDSAEIEELFKAIKRLPEDSPAHVAAWKRLDYLLSWRRRLYLEIVVGLKLFFWSILREMFAQLLLNLRVLFIILSNLLFFGFVIALFYAWARS